MSPTFEASIGPSAALANVVPHFVHLIFFPAGTGTADFNVAPHWTHWILSTMMGLLLGRNRLKLGELQTGCPSCNTDMNLPLYQLDSGINKEDYVEAIA